MREMQHRGFFHACLTRARRRLHGQNGFALIEVVVSAALLMVVAGGVLAGIDGPAAVSAKSEARSQAASLAQQDQERLRSKTIAQLNGYSATNNVTVGTPPVIYSVFSQATWVHDSNDTGSCTVAQDDTAGDYLKIVSRVTPPNGTGSPVQLTSLMTPPPGTYSTTKGTLTVHITNHLDAPVVGQSVSISGPDSQTVSTNSEGCAVFQNIEKGNYTITFSRAGWVDPSSANVVNRSTSVTAGNVTVVNHNYAPSGRLNVSVDTKVGAAAAVASPAKGVTVSNIGIPTGTLTFNAPAAPAQGSSSFALDLYPFPSGYSVWAGVCTNGNPVLYGLPAVSAAPPSAGTAAVTVRQPSINVTGATGVPGFPGTYPNQVGENLVFTSIDAGCSERRQQTAGAGGVFPYLGMPYGNYKLCGDVSGQYGQKTPFANNVTAGQSTTIPYVGNGTCP
jgi:Tfp pilus assembly protein PilV